MLRWTDSKPWIWSVAGCLVLWIATDVISGHGYFGSLMANAAIASFLVIVGLGQMLTISSGGGGIDLSIPYVMTFTAFVSIDSMNGLNSRLIWSVLLALGIGAMVGLINACSILILRIQPIITTLAMGFILDSAIVIYSNQLHTFVPSPLLSQLTTGSVLGIPFLLLVCVIIAFGIGFLLKRMTYGRSLMAVGQNSTAAYLAGARTQVTTALAYISSGILAGLGGLLLSGRDGGAFMEMANPYLLESVGAVVIGGTLISGGKSTVVGTLFGSLFLILLVTLMELTSLPIGVQDIVQGVIIILVISVSGKSSG